MPGHNTLQDPETTDGSGNLAAKGYSRDIRSLLRYIGVMPNSRAPLEKTLN